MTQQEKTGIRELNFSGWIREKLPDSKTGYLVSDIDFVLYNFKTKKLMILEVKTRNAELRMWQTIFYKNISNWLKKGIDEDWTFLGVHIIKFENTFFNDGKCFLDGEEINEENLIEFLSMR